MHSFTQIHRTFFLLFLFLLAYLYRLLCFSNPHSHTHPLCVLSLSLCAGRLSLSLLLTSAVSCLRAQGGSCVRACVRPVYNLCYLPVTLSLSLYVCDFVVPWRGTQCEWNSSLSSLTSTIVFPHYHFFVCIFVLAFFNSCFHYLPKLAWFVPVGLCVLWGKTLHLRATIEYGFVTKSIHHNSLGGDFDFFLLRNKYLSCVLLG